MTPEGETRSFEETLWTVVLKAKNTDDPKRESALNRLCSTYWRPMYAYLRRKGYPPEDAQDRTQAFFLHFLEKDLLARVDRSRGRFKNFLLATLEHFMANEYRKDHAAKRGGGATALSFDFAGEETRWNLHPADPTTPEEAFRRSWAMTVLQNAFAALRREFEDRGLRGHFEAIRSHLSASQTRPSYDDLARRLGCSLTDVTNLLHRTRKRLRELIESALRDTVESERDFMDELAELLNAL